MKNENVKAYNSLPGRRDKSIDDGCKCPICGDYEGSNVDCPNGCMDRIPYVSYSDMEEVNDRYQDALEAIWDREERISKWRS